MEDNKNLSRKDIIDNLNACKINNDYDEYAKLLILGLELKVISVKYFFNRVDRLMNIKLKLARDLYQFFISKYEVSEYDVELSYFKNKLNEKMLYDNFSSEDKEKYNYYKEMGSLAYDNDDYQNALNLYKKGKDLTNHPIFDYYIGKMYFKLKQFDLANEYLLKYELNGGEKEMHSILYLWRNNDNATEEKILELDEKINRLVEFYDGLKKWKLPNLKKKIKCKHSLENIDYKKITEDDFNDKTSVLFNFDSYLFEEQLIIIRELFNNGNIDLSKKLINQLSNSPLGGKERKQLSNIKKLTKIKK